VGLAFALKVPERLTSGEGGWERLVGLRFFQNRYFFFPPFLIMFYFSFYGAAGGTSHLEQWCLIRACAFIVTRHIN
jgi:hypothetical protein